MPQTATVSIEDKARQFLANGWDALYASAEDVPRIMDKQVVYLQGLAKKKSRVYITTEQIRLVQRLVKGNGTKQEASEMISLLVKQKDDAAVIADLPEAPDERRDVEAAKNEVRALLETLDQAVATYQSLSVIAEPADPDMCVYCEGSPKGHVNAMHEFEAPEPEAVLSAAAESRVVAALDALTEWFSKNSK